MRKRKTKNQLPPFVPLTWELLNSKAYKELPANAGKALPYFLGKSGKALRKNDDSCSGIFIFSYLEAKRLGFRSRTFARIINQLHDKGFIETVDQGGLRGEGYSFNKFIWSKRWEKFGTDQFEYKRRYPSEPRKKKTQELKSSVLNEALPKIREETPDQPQTEMPTQAEASTETQKENT